MSTSRTLWLSAAISLVVGVLAATGGVAVANHVFPDVPTTSQFHSAIANVNTAGCVSGFPDGTFDPTANVKRQQAAYWLDACLGRGSSIAAEDSFTNDPGGDDFEADLFVESGGLADVGTGGSFLVITDIDVDTSGDQQSTWTLTHVDGAGPGVDDVLDTDVVTVVGEDLNAGLSLNPSDSTTLMGFVAAESGGDEQFRLSGARNGGVPLANLRGNIAAIWLPFDAST
jgi:hypothetical protein